MGLKERALDVEVFSQQARDSKYYADLLITKIHFLEIADLVKDQQSRIEELELLNYAFEEGSAEWESDYKGCKWKLDKAVKALEYYANGGDWVGDEIDRGSVAKQVLSSGEG